MEQQYGAGYTVVPPNGISTSPTQTTIYTVTVTSISGNCTGTDDVVVNVQPAQDPGQINMTVAPPIICGGQPAILTFTIGSSGSWAFNVVATNLSGNTNLVYNVTGTFSSVPVAPSQTTTYTLNSVTDLTTGCIFYPARSHRSHGSGRQSTTIQCAGPTCNM